MMKRMGAGVVGASLIALSVGIFVAGPGEGRAWAAAQQGVNAKILKLAEAIKAGKKDQVQTLAKELAKEDLEEIMEAFKPRSKKGVGVGRVKGQVTPDGIELKLQTMGRDAPSGALLGKEGEALEEMSYVIAAIAEVALAKGAPGGKGKADWENWSKEMKEAAASLTKAVKDKSGADVKSVSTKINNNCSACHSKFKTS